MAKVKTKSPRVPTLIEKNREETLSLYQLARKIKTRGYSTLKRWCINGLRGIKLEYVKVGRAKESSIDAYWRFIDATNE